MPGDDRLDLVEWPPRAKGDHTGRNRFRDLVDEVASVVVKVLVRGNAWDEPRQLPERVARRETVLLQHCARLIRLQRLDARTNVAVTDLRHHDRRKPRSCREIATQRPGELPGGELGLAGRTELLGQTGKIRLRSRQTLGHLR